MILLRFIGLLGLMLVGAIGIAGCFAERPGPVTKVDKQIKPDADKPITPDDSIPEMVPCDQLDPDAARWVKQPANCMMKKRRPTSSRG